MSNQDYPQENTGQRILAAIVFTDVVGFSTLAGIDEGKALRLLSRDGDLVKAAAHRHGALLVKGTGDGFLVCFASAVEAVTAALEIQEAIRQQASALPDQEVLKHRIGVHIGDVVLLPNDVVGDGVNVAARLQAEAIPGAIALSSTVHDIVRGKITYRAVNLGPKNLKHIVDSVNVWMINPGEDVAGLPKMPTPNKLPIEMPANTPEPSSALRGIFIGFAIVGCLAALGFVLMQGIMGARANQSTKKPAEVPAVVDPKPQKSAEAKPEQKPDTTPQENPQNTPAEPPIDEKPFLTVYNFASLADALERRRDGMTNPRVAKLRRLARFTGWVESSVKAFSEATPLEIKKKLDADKPYSVWGDPSGKIAAKLETGTEIVTLSDFPPREIVRMALALIDRPEMAASERDERTQSLKEFAEETGVTDIKF